LDVGRVECGPHGEEIAINLFSLKPLFVGDKIFGVLTELFEVNLSIYIWAEIGVKLS
jgi:hypothetical protein